MDCAWEAYGRSRLLPVRLRRRMQRTQRIISTQVSADEKTPDEANVLQHFSEMFSTRIRTPNGQRALEREDMALASRYPVSRSTMYGGWLARFHKFAAPASTGRKAVGRAHTRDARTPQR